MRFKFTQKRLDELPFAERGQVDHYDSEQPGLVLRAGSGSKTFFVIRKTAGRMRRFKLARFPDITVARARHLAREMLVQLAEGRDPAVERERARKADITLRQAFTDYTELRKLKPATVKDYRQDIETSFPDWWDKPLASISREMVAKRHAERSKESPARADGAMRVLRAVFNFSIEAYRLGDKPTIVDNPARTLKARKAWNNVDRRTTVIKVNQLPRWFAAVSSLPDDTDTRITGTVRDYLLLLIFTGLRRDEAARLTWKDVDMAEQTLTIPDPKNRRTHSLPLTDFVMSMLRRRMREGDGEWVFPGKVEGKPLNNPNKVIAQVQHASGVCFTSQDLRRTFAAAAELAGVGGYTLKRLLNHSVKQDVTGGYVQLTVESLREPLQRIEDTILRPARNEGHRGDHGLDAVVNERATRPYAAT